MKGPGGSLEGIQGRQIEGSTNKPLRGKEVIRSFDFDQRVHIWFGSVEKFDLVSPEKIYFDLSLPVSWERRANQKKYTFLQVCFNNKYSMEGGKIIQWEM